MRPQDYQQASPDSRRRIDVGLLRRTIERQLSPELTLALTGTTTVARHGLPVAGSFMSGSCMRIADLFGSSRAGCQIGSIADDRERQLTQCGSSTCGIQKSALGHGFRMSFKLEDEALSLGPMRSFAEVVAKGCPVSLPAAKVSQPFRFRR
jgi:hypothetical protein